MSQSLTNAGGQWREPKTVAVAAEPVVFAETATDEWTPMTRAEAAPFGGPVGALEETSPGSDVFEPVEVALADDTAEHITHVLVGSTITAL